MIRCFVKLPAYLFSSKFSKDYYSVLNIDKKAGEKEIRQAFKDLAKKHHPDLAKGSQQKFKQINEAYQTLSDKTLKSQYDINFKPDYKQWKPSPDYDTYNSTEAERKDTRQYLRKRHEEAMRQYGNKRKDYSDLDGMYGNYDQFVNKKMGEKFKPKVKISLDKVQKMYEENMRKIRQKQEKQKQMQMQRLKEHLQMKKKVAQQNIGEMFDGLKKMGNYVKDMFKKK